MAQQQVKLGQPVNRRLGDLLVADGLLTADQLKKAIAEQRGSPEKLGSILIRLNFVNEDQLIGFLSRQYGVPSITLAQLDIDPDVLKLVPAPIARKYEVIPVRKMGNSLALAMADPTNVFALDDISFMTNLQVLPLVASQTAIKKAVDRNYESKTEAISSVLSDMQTDLSNVEVVEEGEEGAKVEASAKGEMRSYSEAVKLNDGRLLDYVKEFTSPWSVTMQTIWPNLIVQRELNTLGTRQIVPHGPNEFTMIWTMFGYEGDSDEMRRHRLRQGNLMGPAGFLGLEDNEAMIFVQDGVRKSQDGAGVLELGGREEGTSATLITEAAIRSMYRHWREVMEL